MKNAAEREGGARRHVEPDSATNTPIQRVVAASTHGAEAARGRKVSGASASRPLGSCNHVRSIATRIIASQFGAQALLPWEHARRFAGARLPGGLGGARPPAARLAPRGLRDAACTLLERRPTASRRVAIGRGTLRRPAIVDAAQVTSLGVQHRGRPASPRPPNCRRARAARSCGPPRQRGRSEADRRLHATGPQPRRSRAGLGDHAGAPIAPRDAEQPSIKCGARAAPAAASCSESALACHYARGALWQSAVRRRTPRRRGRAQDGLAGSSEAAQR